MRGLLCGRFSVQFPDGTLNPSFDFFPFRVALRVALCSFNASRGEAGIKMSAPSASGERFEQTADYTINLLFWKAGLLT